MIFRFVIDYIVAVVGMDLAAGLDLVVLDTDYFVLVAGTGLVVDLDPVPLLVDLELQGFHGMFRFGCHCFLKVSQDVFVIYV